MGVTSGSAHFIRNEFTNKLLLHFSFVCSIHYKLSYILELVLIYNTESRFCISFYNNCKYIIASCHLTVNFHRVKNIWLYYCSFLMLQRSMVSSLNTSQTIHGFYIYSNVYQRNEIAKEQRGFNG